MYAPARLGGIGVFSFTRKIPIIINQRCRKLSTACPDFQTLLAEADQWLNRIGRMIKPDATTKEQVDRKNGVALEGSFYGGGTMQFANDPSASAYIDNPPRFWKGQEYIKAIKIRLNCLPTRGLPYNSAEERKCRAGCNRVESLSHVLQKCPIAHTQRMKRHNFIAQRLKTMASKLKWSVEEEPHIRDSRGVLRKPDLVLSNEDRVVVLDVSVNWECPRDLAESFDIKRLVYDQPEFTSVLETRYEGKTVKVLPFIIGARGMWCRNSNQTLDELGINTKVNRGELLYTALRGGWHIHDDFSRRAWQ